MVGRILLWPLVWLVVFPLAMAFLVLVGTVDMVAACMHLAGHAVRRYLTQPSLDFLIALGRRARAHLARPAEKS